MNPWRAQLIDLCRNVLRFTLWVCVVINGLMLGLFTVWFTYKFLFHASGWLGRGLFSKPW